MTISFCENIHTHTKRIWLTFPRTSNIVSVHTCAKHRNRKFKIITVKTAKKEFYIHFGSMQWRELKKEKGSNKSIQNTEK